MILNAKNIFLVIYCPVLTLHNHPLKYPCGSLQFLHEAILNSRRQVPIYMERADFASEFECCKVFLNVRTKVKFTLGRQAIWRQNNLLAPVSSVLEN